MSNSKITIEDVESIQKALEAGGPFVAAKGEALQIEEYSKIADFIKNAKHIMFNTKYLKIPKMRKK